MPHERLILGYAFLSIFGVEALPADALANPGGRKWFDSTSTPLSPDIAEYVMFLFRRTTVVAWFYGAD